VNATTYPPEWLRLREGADADARAAELLEPLRAALPDPPLVVRDLGCGDGAMGRWLAGRLPGPQHWILHDRAPGPRAGDALPGGGQVTVVRGDIAGIGTADLAGTSLVTTSALLDLLTAAEMTGLAAACAGAGCPALLTLTVTGRVAFDSPDPLDAVFTAAFNDHQRRHGRLGPDAPGVAAAAFERLGATVRRRPSPWRLGLERAALAARWLRGWVAAAVEQVPDLALVADAYLDRRHGVRVVVGHEDLLALPGGGS
jgi:hypothetical protein